MGAGAMMELGIEGVVAFIQTAEGKDLIRVVKEAVDAIERKGVDANTAIAAAEFAADEAENAKFGR